MTSPAEMRLIDPEGRRLYLTCDERRAFLEAARHAPREVRIFCTVLHDTGCRLSEALELVPVRIDLANGAIEIEASFELGVVHVVSELWARSASAKRSPPGWRPTTGGHLMRRRCWR